MPLSDKAIQNAKPLPQPYKLTDGDGMYLEVHPTGSKYWRLKYRFAGKEKRLAIGVYPETSLALAREKRLAARKLLAAGVDPSTAKQEAKRHLQHTEQQNTTHTFEAIARKWHAHYISGWTARHATYILRRLELDVFPVIGHRPINSITPQELLLMLQAIEARGAHELARRIKDTCGQIFRYAIVHASTETYPITNNPAALMKARDIFKPQVKTHFAALPEAELPKLLAKLSQNDARLYPHTRLAMLMMVHTFVRTSELINARWSEFDFVNKVWIIPAERMKMRREHLVPLTKQTLAYLDQLQTLREVFATDAGVPDYVFPSQINPRKSMSNNTLLKALERLGYKSVATGHGFRALAMTTIKERLGVRHEVVDRQLAHARADKVQAAYDRAEFIVERTSMMEAWSEYLDKLLKAETRASLSLSA